jgi:hypothetical protein
MKRRSRVLVCTETKAYANLRAGKSTMCGVCREIFWPVQSSPARRASIWWWEWLHHAVPGPRVTHPGHGARNHTLWQVSRRRINAHVATCIKRTLTEVKQGTGSTHSLQAQRLLLFCVSVLFIPQAFICCILPKEQKFPFIYYVATGLNSFNYFLLQKFFGLWALLGVVGVRTFRVACSSQSAAVLFLSAVTCFRF